MQPVKFRIWDREKDRFTDPHNDNVMINQLGTIAYSYEDYEFGVIDADIMEFTGYYDAFCNPIYVGDIVCILGCGAYDENAKVTKHGHEFMLEDVYTECPIESITVFMEDKDIEIIGNVHENKELLMY